MEEEVNVLIIEDKEDSAVFLYKTVSGLGFKVWLARSVDEAVKLAKNTPVAVVFTELYMPQGEAREITRQMLGINPLVNVVVITTSAFINSAVEAMQEGAYNYIIKPFNPLEVRMVLERAVERFSLLSSGQDRERFVKLSVKDDLTGAYNRRLFDPYLTDKIYNAKRTGGRFSLLMIDIDHFKEFNDTQGHVAGDELLKKLCGLFTESIRKGDVLFRYGGEEFIVLLEGVDKKIASLVAERIRTFVELSISTTISVGVSSFPEDGETLENLVSRADAALYRAKKEGRNKVCVA